jgi:hypothetical protein
VFAIDGHGQLFRKEKHIPWDDIVAFKRLGSFLAWLLDWHHTVFFLRDGSHFTVYSNLEAEGPVPKPPFALLPKTNPTYGEFVALLEGRSGARSIWNLRAGRYEWLWLISGVLGGIGANTLMRATGLIREDLVFERAVLGMAVASLFALCGLVVQRVLRGKHIREFARCRHRAHKDPS